MPQKNAGQKGNTSQQDKGEANPFGENPKKQGKKSRVPQLLPRHRGKKKKRRLFPALKNEAK
jgi:hypothetical protein